MYSHAYYSHRILTIRPILSLLHQYKLFSVDVRSHRIQAKEVTTNRVKTTSMETWVQGYLANINTSWRENKVNKIKHLYITTILPDIKICLICINWSKNKNYFNRCKLTDQLVFFKLDYQNEDKHRDSKLLVQSTTTLQGQSVAKPGNPL